MQAPKVPDNEIERLSDLKSYHILDTLSETEYDNLTQIASEICNTPISLISLIDENRQWFKSAQGLDAKETPREYAFCGHAINKPDEVLIVEDSRKDDRFKDNPLVTDDPKVIFYAGVPLITEKGFPLGTLCVIDNEPKHLNKNQINSLSALSNQAMQLIELRKKTRLLNETLANLEQRNEELHNFAFTAAHDLKSPLNNISGLLEMFNDSFASSVGKEGSVILEHIKDSTENLRNLISSLLKYSQNNKLLKKDKTFINVKKLEADIRSLFSNTDGTMISFKSEIDELYANKTAIIQILINLISNSIKYNDKDSTQVEIGISENKDDYMFYVEDNGPGIDMEQRDKIFKIFTVLKSSDKFGKRGNGIGLATVKKLVLAFGGSIDIESKKGLGSKFIFNIKK